MPNHDVVVHWTQQLREGARLVVRIDEHFEAGYYMVLASGSEVKLTREVAEALPWGRMIAVSVSQLEQVWEMVPGL